MFYRNSIQHFREDGIKDGMLVEYEVTGVNYEYGRGRICPVWHDNMVNIINNSDPYQSRFVLSVPRFSLYPDGTSLQNSSRYPSLTQVLFKRPDLDGRLDAGYVLYQNKKSHNYYVKCKNINKVFTGIAYGGKEIVYKFPKHLYGASKKTDIPAIGDLVTVALGINPTEVWKVVNWRFELDSNEAKAILCMAEPKNRTSHIVRSVEYTFLVPVNMPVPIKDEPIKNQKKEISPVISSNIFPILTCYHEGNSPNLVKEMAKLIKIDGQLKYGCNSERCLSEETKGIGRNDFGIYVDQNRMFKAGFSQSKIFELFGEKAIERRNSAQTRSVFNVNIQSSIQCDKCKTLNVLKEYDYLEETIKCTYCNNELKVDQNKKIHDEFVCSICTSVVPCDKKKTMFHDKDRTVLAHANDDESNNNHNDSCQKLFCVSCLEQMKTQTPNKILSCPNCRGNIAESKIEYGKYLEGSIDWNKYFSSIHRDSLMKLEKLEGSCSVCSKELLYKDFNAHQSQNCNNLCIYENCKLPIQNNIDAYNAHYVQDCLGIQWQCLFAQPKDFFHKLFVDSSELIQECKFTGTVFQVADHMNTCELGKETLSKLTKQKLLTISCNFQIMTTMAEKYKDKIVEDKDILSHWINSTQLLETTNSWLADRKDKDLFELFNPKEPIQTKMIEEEEVTIISSSKKPNKRPRLIDVEDDDEIENFVEPIEFMPMDY